MIDSKTITRFGWGLLIVIICLTPLLIRNIKSVDKNITFKSYTEGIEGKTGTLKETYENRQITLAYDSISTRTSQIFIKPARVTFEDQSGKWFIEGSSAIRRDDQWTIYGPLYVSFKDSNNILIGEGLANEDTPCLLWSRGSWQGLVPIKWSSRPGLFGGLWTLPKGWIRRSNGAFESQASPTTFLAKDDGQSKLKSLQADVITTTEDLNEIFLMRIRSTLLLGNLETSKATVTDNEINFPTTVSFERKKELMLKSDNAHYIDRELSSILSLNNVNGSRFENNITETVRSDHASIFIDISRFNGNVEWNRIDGSSTAKITSPDIYIRERQGSSYPSDVQPNEIFSPKSTEVTLNDIKFSSETLRFNKRDFIWSLGPTVRGKSKDGIYSGGTASGNRDSWKMQGPIKYELLNNQGVLLGAFLTGTKLQWTLSGEPVLWRRGSDLITTANITKNGSLIKFPGQLRGVFREQKGDITVDASSGLFENNVMQLDGPIVLNGLGWSCNARKASITFDTSRKISIIRLEGEVALRGGLGEGTGDRLEIVPKPGDKTYTIHWEGRVRGTNKIYD